MPRLRFIRPTEAATMKSISRRICGVLVGLVVLDGIVPLLRADEMADWMAEQRRQNDEYHRQWREWREAQDRADREAQVERDARDRWYQEQQQQREAQDRWNYEQEQQRQAQAQAQADREAMDKYWRDVQAARDADAAWYENQRRQKEWDDWMNNYSWGHWPLGEPETTATQAPAGRSAVGSTAVVILNPYALEKMAPQDQKRMRELAMQTGLPILQEPHEFYQQMITNPFVRSPK